MLKWTLRLGAVVIILALAAGALYYGMTAHFNPAPPLAAYPKPASPLEAQRQDLDYFAKLIAMDQAFSPSARAEANTRLAALAASATILDRGQLRVALLKVVALADNGHTSLYSKKPVRAVILPIRFAPFSDGLYVMRARSENADLLGAKIVAIDGHPVEDVLSAMAQLRGGTQAFRRGYAQELLNSSEFLHGLGIAASPDRSTWTFQTRAGRTLERVLNGAQPDYEDPFPDLWRWMSPLPIKGDKSTWLAFTPDNPSLPVTFQNPDQIFRRLHIADACAVLVQLKANLDQDGEIISDFLNATEADLKADKPCSIILDDRFNGGGDYTNTAGFAGRLPSLVKPGGHIYVLTGPNTFSAGITTGVFVKQAAALGQVVILGEPVGDRLTFFSEGASGCLPNAPFCFHYTTGMHDYTHPCTDWRKCYWLNWIYPARTDNLNPQQTITTSFADYLAGRDPVFERAVALAKADAH